MLLERLKHYNEVKGPHGERLATMYRFQNKPSSEYPQIYLPHDSLLNHKSRLIRNTHLLLKDILPPSEKEELQLILACHDVPELIEGDVSRLARATIKKSAESSQKTIEELLLPEDIARYHDFEKAQQFLERGADLLPDNYLSLIARIMDTYDGNIFAYALLENYARKVGGETLDSSLQTVLDKSDVYVNKMRLRYRERIAQVGNHYNLDITPLLTRIQDEELAQLARFSSSLAQNGYRTTPLV